MTLYTAGQKVRAAELNTLPQTYRVASPQICNNSTSLRDIVGLSFAGEANAIYLVESFLAYHATTTGDIRFGWIVPSGAAGGDSPIYTGSFWTAQGVQPTAAGAQGFIDESINTTITTTHARSGDNAVPVLACPVTFIAVGSTAGTCKMQFSQQSAIVHDTTIRVGSCMRVTKMA